MYSLENYLTELMEEKNYMPKYMEKLNTSEVTTAAFWDTFNNADILICDFRDNEASAGEIIYKTYKKALDLMKGFAFEQVFSSEFIIDLFVVAAIMQLGDRDDKNAELLKEWKEKRYEVEKCQNIAALINEETEYNKEELLRKIEEI